MWQVESVEIVFDAELWLWDARRNDAWVFVTLPSSDSEEIRDLAGGLRRGFGSVRVRARIGGSEWATSIFPSSADGTYVLPLRKKVRDAEQLFDGGPVKVRLEVLDG